MEVTDVDVEAEVAAARVNYAADRATVAYFESERGRNSIRNTMRRSRTVEMLIDEWLDAHPEAPRVRHHEDERTGVVETDAEEEASPEATASTGA